jgi:hypothetical protein
MNVCKTQNKQIRRKCHNGMESYDVLPLIPARTVLWGEEMFEPVLIFVTLPFLVPQTLVPLVPVHPGLAGRESARGQIVGKRCRARRRDYSAQISRTNVPPLGLAGVHGVKVATGSMRMTTFGSTYRWTMKENRFDGATMNIVSTTVDPGTTS